MKKIFYLVVAFMIFRAVSAQQIYCNFEDAKLVVFNTWTGTLDSLIVNPNKSGADTSAFCAMYMRSVSLYDNLKIVPIDYLGDAAAYASSSVQAPRIKMKVYTTAPIGTPVAIQLGDKDDDNYPSGIHSEYIAVTTVQNSWELLTFTFVKIPQGSMVNAVDIDKITLMFNPGSPNQDVFYFDELMGPQLNAIGIEKISGNTSFKLHQNSPNPAKELTRISFNLKSSGPVSLKLYDVLGNQVSSLLDKQLAQGDHSVPVEIEDLSNGIYFYTLKINGVSETRRMVVSK